jgi:hypothetical protein
VVAALGHSLALVIGAAGLVAGALAGALSPPGRRPGALAAAGTLAAAGLEAGSDAAVSVARAGWRAADRMRRLAGAAPRPAFVQERIDAVRESADAWQTRVDAVQRDRERRAGEALQTAVGRVLAGIDLGVLLRDVDLTALVHQIDLDRVIDEVDLDRLLDRVDLDRVLDRVDLNAILGRVDLDALVGRLDLSGITNEVLEEIDIQAIIRESTTGVGTEAVRAARSQAVRGDVLVARVVDRLLLRRAPRRLDAPEPTDPEGDR